MPVIVNCAVYGDGRRQQDVAIDALPPPSQQPGEFVWIGLHEPDEATLAKVQAAFSLHPLAVEDAHRAHQRPKLEFYGDALFLVLRTAQIRGERTDIGETHVFAGKGYVVTVRHGASSSYSQVRARCEASPAMLRHGEDYVLYSIIDFVVDNYVPVLEKLEDEVDAIEEEILNQTANRATITRIYRLKKDVMAVRRSVAPIIEMASRLMRPDIGLIDPETRHYFRDVQDHALRVVESLDTLRDLLGAALDASFAYLSMSQNEVMRRLGAWAAILAVPTAIAGIYGMNFDVMPELRFSFGYPMVILFIFSLCSLLYWQFRKKGWL